METKEHSSPQGRPAFTASRCPDRSGSKAVKDKQLSFVDFSHLCDGQSYQVKPMVFQYSIRNPIFKHISINFETQLLQEEGEKSYETSIFEIPAR